MLTDTAYRARNSYTSLNWAYTSIVFQASSPVTTIDVRSQNSGDGGMYFDAFSLKEAVPSGGAAPIVEWNGLTSGSPPATEFTSVRPQEATATYSPAATVGFTAAQAIDGTTNDNFGWSITSGVANQTAVFETATNIGFPSGTVLTFNLCQYALRSGQPYTLGRFRLSVTTHDRSTFADGLSAGGDVTANWTVLVPVSITETLSEF